MHFDSFVLFRCILYAKRMHWNGQNFYSILLDAICLHSNDWILTIQYTQLTFYWQLIVVLTLLFTILSCAYLLYLSHLFASGFFSFHFTAIALLTFSKSNPFHFANVVLFLLALPCPLFCCSWRVLVLMEQSIFSFLDLCFILSVSQAFCRCRLFNLLLIYLARSLSLSPFLFLSLFKRIRKLG